jgi:hypothetical protein
VLGNIVKVRIVHAGIIETVTVGGIYALRRLQLMHCGRLGPRAVLVIDCRPDMIPNIKATGNDTLEKK